VSSTIDPLYARIAEVALSVSARHGFALGGGCALVAHGLVARPTEDIDLFTASDSGVRAATDLVLAALRHAGLAAEREDELEELFDGMDDAFVEIMVRDDDAEVRLSLAQIGFSQAPVVMSVGPVMHLDDLIGSKVCAWVARGEIRDYIDVAAALERYDRDELIRLALTKDPYLTDEDFAAAVRRLDSVPDEPFVHYGLSTVDVSRLRGIFASWPR
jgi:hypothetical protein